MDKAKAIHNRVILKELLKSFIDNPSEKTARGILEKAPKSYCWLMPTQIFSHRESCPSICPGLRKDHNPHICNSLSLYYDTWKHSPEEALLFAIQLLAFLESFPDTLEEQ